MRLYRGPVFALKRPHARALLPACALVAAGGLGAGLAAQGAGAASGAGASAPAFSATLTQCQTSLVQAERSATFSGEMTATPATARMAMRIEVQERFLGEAQFHTLSVPGLGVWRGSEARVKVYRYLKQVTNLSSPAVYRAAVRFRWQNAKGRVIKTAERTTQRCAEPASPVTELPSGSETASAPAASAPAPAAGG